MKALSNCDYYELDKIASFIGNYCSKWGRINTQCKEKYGIVIVDTVFTELSLHSLIYPNLHYYAFPNWLIYLDIKVFTPVITFLLGFIMHKWRRFVYSRAYHIALRHWPQYTKEILMFADYPEFIKNYEYIKFNSEWRNYGIE